MNAQELISVYHIGWVGLAAGSSFVALDALINANPLAQRLYAGYRPIMRTSVNAALGVTVDLVFGLVMALLFVALTPALPVNWLAKGVAFGLIVWFFRTVMNAASHTVMFQIPISATIYTLITGLAEMILLGLLYAVLLRPR